MNKFEIGEIAIIDNSVHKPEFVGMECEIISREIYGIAKGTEYAAYGYIVEINGETHGFVKACLRKKKPPQELSTWEEVEKLTHWNPTKVYV